MEALEAWPLLCRLSGCLVDEEEEEGGAEEIVDGCWELEERGHSTVMAICNLPLALEWPRFALGRCGVISAFAESGERRVWGNDRTSMKDRS